MSSAERIGQKPDAEQGELAHSEPVQSEPVQSEPVQSEPVQSEPVQFSPELFQRLCETAADIVWFPVRHHSPGCAALLGQWIERYRPAAVLIEGPSDYNEYLDELLLDHRLPIAIYTYLRTAAGSSGAFYPFCDYSPEWVALRRGRELGAAVQFIDLPWRQQSRDVLSTHRYADAELRRGRYVERLCERMQVEDFDDLWDKVVESEEELKLEEYLRRAHSLCYQIRLWEETISEADQQREAFMAGRVRQARRDHQGRLLVVTGGFHCSALAARLAGLPCPGIDVPERSAAPLAAAGQSEVPEAAGQPVDVPDSAPEGNPDGNHDDTAECTADRAAVCEAGTALTTYSYERLDSLQGYEAGMPNPGFYDHVWRQRCGGQPFSHEELLRRVAVALRERGQTLSTADLIAVETAGRALAAIRGRRHVWRRDLLDAVSTALIKDELEYGCESPLLDAVHEVLRGDRRGRLAEGTRLPPLVADIHSELEGLDLQLTRAVRDVRLNLLDDRDRRRGRTLHRLRILGVAGIRRSGGTDFLSRQDWSDLWETWQIRWSPEFDASCIEASRYGTSLADAASNRLLESARQLKRDAAEAAALLVESAQAGIDTLNRDLLDRLAAVVREEARFAAAAEALDRVLFLYCFDEAFETQDLPQIGQLLRDAFARALWLLELQGQTGQGEQALVLGVRSLLETFRRTAEPLELDGNEFVAVLERVEGDRGKPAQLRGAAAGALWALNAADNQRILANLLLMSDANQLGDFLVGLFAVGREVAQRDAELVRTIDRLLLEFAADDFQAALPALRLAFTYFTPREKHHMLNTLFEALGMPQAAPLAAVRVDASAAAEALNFEERLFEAIERYGLEERNE